MPTLTESPYHHSRFPGLEVCRRLAFEDLRPFLSQSVLQESEQSKVCSEFSFLSFLCLCCSLPVPRSSQ